MEKPLYSVVMPIMHHDKAILSTALNCIGSVKANGENYEIIIVDNGSTERYPWDTEADTYIRFSTNRGISHAWNAGIKASRSDNIAIINDDVIVCPHWLEKLKNALNEPQAGVSNVYVQHLPQGKGLVENYKWFSGSCFMLPRRTVNRVGYFDEGYEKANFEDVDYWTRLLRAGLKMYVDYSSTIMHLEGQTVHRKEISRHFLKNKERYIKKWGFDPTPYFYGDAPFPLV